jgi:hypothetical protein
MKTFSNERKPRVLFVSWLAIKDFWKKVPKTKGKWYQKKTCSISDERITTGETRNQKIIYAYIYTHIYNRKSQWEKNQNFHSVCERHS